MKLELGRAIEMVHLLHEIVGKCIDGAENSKKFPTNIKIIKSIECGGQQNIPLFCRKVKSDETEYCNVDMLILKNNQIRVIIEIEETNLKPTQICGKFLTSVLSSYFIHYSGSNTPIKMSDSVSFIQILDTSQLKKETSKVEQWKNLERSITKILPVKGSNIRKYKIFYGNVSDFENGTKCTELITCIEKALK